MNPPAALEAKGVCFAYGKGSRAYRFSDWDASFPAGSITAISGPSGCGKSTRLYLLGLMLRPQRGRVYLGGERVDDLPDAGRSALRARSFGFVFQDAILDATRTVLDNVVEAAIYRGEQPHVSRLRAQELIEHLGVTVPLARRPGEISGGQAQRIATCRALLGAPAVLLADEPTGNLDPESADAVLAAFREHADAGGCVVMVTHDPLVARRADAQVMLEAAT